jgi:hypothetical protein
MTSQGAAPAGGGESGATKLDFERAKTCFEQDLQSFRALDESMWKIPMIAITLTGGLWYGVASGADLPLIATRVILGFAGFVNVCLILVLWRVRHLMAAHLTNVKAFYAGPGGPGAPKVDWLPQASEFLRSKFVVKCFTAALSLAAVLSFLGIALPSRMRKKENAPTIVFAPWTRGSQDHSESGRPWIDVHELGTVLGFADASDVVNEREVAILVKGIDCSRFQSFLLEGRADERALETDRRRYGSNVGLAAERALAVKLELTKQLQAKGCNVLTMQALPNRLNRRHYELDRSVVIWGLSLDPPE